MFKRQRQYNIISGAASLRPLIDRIEQYRTNVTKYHNNPQSIISPLKLGVSRDRRQFQYSYDVPDIDSLKKYPLSERSITKQSSYNNVNLLGSVSTNYNLINHMDQLDTSLITTTKIFQKKLPQANKKGLLTKHIHRNRLVAPNYHQGYELKSQNGQFFKKQGICSTICDIQKSYAQGKYFRKFK